jgi:predicted porin
MKKSLIALAVLAASGAAMAQSSVTLYGVADMAVGKVSQAAGGLALTNDDFQAITSSTLNNGTSRFGLHGTEDLGGGLKAGFNFEGGLSLANGAGNLSGGQLFSRAANMSLMGGFGEIRAGRSLTTSFYSVASWELTGTANYSVVANQFGFAGPGPRETGQVMWNSPNWGGLSLSASTVLKGNGVYTVGGVNKGKYDLAATYAAGPVTASLAYNKVQSGPKGLTIGGKFNAGVAQIAASYNNYETAAGVTVNKGFSLGASANLGGISLTADLARDTKAKDTDWVVEAKYPLSKRTFAYGVVMRDGKGKAGRTTNVTGYAAGVRHNF